MSIGSAGERRLLAKDEYEPVTRSHSPELRGLDRAELVQLARWLRERRNRARGGRLRRSSEERERSRPCGPMGLARIGRS